MGTMTELPAAGAPPSPQAAAPARTTLQPPDEITRSLFVRSRRVARAHPLAADALAAALVLAVCTVWLTGRRSPACAPGWSRRP